MHINADVICSSQYKGAAYFWVRQEVMWVMERGEVIVSVDQFGGQHVPGVRYSLDPVQRVGTETELTRHLELDQLIMTGMDP